MNRQDADRMNSQDAKNAKVEPAKQGKILSRSGCQERLTLAVSAPLRLCGEIFGFLTQDPLGLSWRPWRLGGWQVLLS